MKKSNLMLSAVLVVALVVAISSILISCGGQAPNTDKGPASHKEDDSKLESIWGELDITDINVVCDKITTLMDSNNFRFLEKFYVGNKLNYIEIEEFDTNAMFVQFNERCQYIFSDNMIYTQNIPGGPFKKSQGKEDDFTKVYNDTLTRIKRYFSVMSKMSWTYNTDNKKFTAISKGVTYELTVINTGVTLFQDDGQKETKYNEFNMMGYINLARPTNVI